MVNAREDGIKVPEQPKRTLEEDLEYIERVSPYQFTIRPGFVPGMRVPGSFYVDDTLWALLRDELRVYCESGGERGAFLPAVKQIANVASLPGIVGTSVALPDVHSGYGFSIGNVAAFDVGDPEAIVSPGGVGFDINCGVRLLRTSLMEHQVAGLREELAQALFDHIPVGVGSQGLIPATMADLNAALELGMDWSLREGYAWPEDKERCEEQGRMLGADPSRVSERAKRRGLPQLGTLGAGNHYAEIQVVEEIFNPEAARAMGIDRLGQVCVMIHSGSRGLGHEVAKDAVDSMLARLRRTGATINDRQLACAPVASPEGQDYLAAMACAANYAWVNRSAMTFLARQAFSKIFKKSPVELDMHVVYDVSHNIAKLERHSLGGRTRTLLVHRKGATRAFPPHSPLIPAEYQLVGQPVLVGGTMGTCSYVLTGTHKAMEATFGSTCHGAGRSLSRNAARNRLDYAQVLQALKARGIAIRVASPKLVMEEAPESYKDVCHVVDTCHHAGITLKAVKLRPIAVIKG